MNFVFPLDLKSTNSDFIWGFYTPWLYSKFELF